VPLVSTLWPFLMHRNNDGKISFNTQQYLRGRISRLPTLELAINLEVETV
jgi:hypothetical protein